MYRWHPLYGQQLTVWVGERFLRGLRYSVDGTQRDRLMLPAWMLDGAICDSMDLIEDPHVDWKAMDELVLLLSAGQPTDSDIESGQAPAHESASEEAAGAVRTSRGTNRHALEPDSGSKSRRGDPPAGRDAPALRRRARQRGG
jgi:hypothetical protein